MTFSEFLQLHNDSNPLNFRKGKGRAFATTNDGTQIFISTKFDSSLPKDTRWVVESDGTKGDCPAGTYFLTNSTELKDAGTFD